jgi:hypothetical protein
MQTGRREAPCFFCFPSVKCAAGASHLEMEILRCAQNDNKNVIVTAKLSS